jgi:hypothetical protein
MKSLVRVLLLFIFCAQAFAQVTHVSSATNSTSAAGLTVSSAAAVDGTAGNLLLTCTSYETTTTPGTTVSSVVSGASPLTEAVFIDVHNRVAAIHYLANPGNATVTATLTGNSQRISLHSMVVSGANTASPISDNDEIAADSPATTVTLTLTTAANDLLYDCLTRVGNDQAGTTAGADQIQRSTFGSGAATITHKSSTQPGSSGGAMSWDMSGGSDAAYVAVNIAAAGGGGVVVNPLSGKGGAAAQPVTIH